MKKTSFTNVVLLFFLIGTLLACLPAGAQDNNGNFSYSPITKVNLGVENLSLEPGESYSFQVSYEPEVPAFTTLIWTVSDESVVAVDPVTFTVTALNPGTARILAESFDRVSYTWCDVTVGGSEAKSQNAFSISNDARSKITAKSVLRHLEMLENASYSQKAMERRLLVSADVTPGSEEAESRRALDLGMSRAEPLPELNIVNLEGTFEQILAFTENNSDLLKLFELNDAFLSDETDDGLEEKAIFGDSSKVEEITSVSVAHDLGYKGKNTSIAILDTGINIYHSQFKDRIIRQHCFSTNTTTDDNGRFQSACRNGASESDSAYPRAFFPNEFNHGTHVAGIAAGKDGIAPAATIIAVQIFSERIWQCNKNDKNYKIDLDQCYVKTVQWQDELKAYNWIINQQNSLSSSQKISAVNISYGGDQSYADFCSFDERYSSYQKMVKAGMIPVIASGDNGWNDGVNSPACMPSDVAITVGAIDGTYDNTVTEKNKVYVNIADYSNHSRPHIDILAPGNKIYQALLLKESENCPIGGDCMGTMENSTSFAAPMVSGAVALMRSSYPKYNPKQMTALFEKISYTSAKNKTGSGVKYNYEKPVLDFAGLLGTMKITDANVRGKNREIQIGVPITKWSYEKDKKVSFSVTVYDDATGQRIPDDNYELKIRPDSNNQNWVINMLAKSGKTPTLVNGTVYRIEIVKYVTLNDKKTVASDKVSKYGMPIANVYGATVVAGNHTMTINNQYREFTSGVRYMLFDAATETEFAHKLGTKNNTVWTYNALENGKLYYVVAVPYRVYKNVYLWGPNQNRIYFIPLSAPSTVRVNFINASQAVISMAEDPNADGIRVLYRKGAGALQNGCESESIKCTISGLKSSESYDFYVMKYKKASYSTRSNQYADMKFYSASTMSSNRRDNYSGLTAPQNSPVVAMRNNGYTTFTIKKSANAEGISVLYREGTETAFKKACERADNTCGIQLDVTKNYIFYIMQYRTQNNRKVYSPGIIARDFSSGKGPDEARVYYNFEAADESLYLEDIYASIDDFYTENDLVMDEINEFLSNEAVIGKNDTFEEDELIDIVLDDEELMNADLDESDEIVDGEYLEDDFVDGGSDEGFDSELPEETPQYSYTEDYGITMYGVDNNYNNGYVPSFGN